jgi:chemotaxis protein CheZ
VLVNLAATIEEQLVKLLIQTAPATTAKAVKALPQPEHNVRIAVRPGGQSRGNPDVVTDQSQVDDLLASLGF